MQLITPSQHIRRVTASGAARTPMAAVRRVLTRIRNGELTLDWEKAAEIRRSEGACKDVAARYGVSASMVSCIRRGKAWREPAGLGALM